MCSQKGTWSAWTSWTAQGRWVAILSKIVQACLRFHSPPWTWLWVQNCTAGQWAPFEVQEEHLAHRRRRGQQKFEKWLCVSWSLQTCEQLLDHFKIVVNTTRAAQCQLSVLSSRATEYAQKRSAFSRSWSYTFSDSSEMRSATVLAERLMLLNWPFFSRQALLAASNMHFWWTRLLWMAFRP